MKRIISIIALCLCVLSVKAQFPFQSRVVTDTIYSEVLNAKRAYNVLLPQGFDQQKNKTYPVLYLLHGMWGNNTDWTGPGRVKDVMDRLIASGEACEMIVITPDAGGGDPNVVQNGYYNMPGWDYETFFFTEFLPHVEKKYRVIGDKQHRAVAGLSMGGGGAAGYGQLHADKFSAVYAMSALMDIPEVGAVPANQADGPMAKLTRSVIDNSCVKYVQKADEARKALLRSVSWFVDCGDDDFLLDRNIEFFRAMRQAGIPCQFRIRDGGHDWEYWHSALYTCLPFVSREFQKPMKEEFHVYLCLGQSNMEGNARIEAQDTIGVNKRFQVMQAVDCSDRGRVKGEWYKAVPPLARCRTGLTPVDYFGRTLVAELPEHIKVGVINVAVGGCKIELFDKENYQTYVNESPDWLKNMVNEYDGNPYARLIELAQKAQQEGGVIKGILLHQGESNTGDQEWPKKVKAMYDSLLQDLKLDPNSVPLLAGEVVHEKQGGVCASMNEIINTLPEVHPNSYVISSADCDVARDNLHFNAAGYRELGRRYAKQMLTILGY